MSCIMSHEGQQSRLILSHLIERSGFSSRVMKKIGSSRPIQSFQIKQERTTEGAAEGRPADQRSIERHGGGRSVGRLGLPHVTIVQYSTAHQHRQYAVVHRQHCRHTRQYATLYDSSVQQTAARTGRSVGKYQTKLTHRRLFFKWGNLDQQVRFLFLWSQCEVALRPILRCC